MCIAATAWTNSSWGHNTKEIKHKTHKNYPLNSRRAISETLITKLFCSSVSYLLVQKMFLFNPDKIAIIYTLLPGERFPTSWSLCQNEKITNYIIYMKEVLSQGKSLSKLRGCIMIMFDQRKYKALARNIVRNREEAVVWKSLIRNPQRC